MAKGRNGWLLAACLASGVSASGETFLPVFSSGDFDPGAAIDHPYFPQVPGTLRVSEGLAYDAEDDAFVPERVIERVLPGRRTVAGVDAVVVYAQEFIDGLMVEETWDWYAQDRSGNVWYLGEDTAELEYDDEDNLIGRFPVGAWEAGVNGAVPGYLLPAELTPGFAYYQEFAPADDAVDEGLIAELDVTVTGPLDTFEDVLRVVDSTALEPGVLENKYYARGIGLIRSEGAFDTGGDPRTVIELTSVSAVPSPTAAACGLIGLGGLALRRRPGRASTAGPGVS